MTSTAASLAKVVAVLACVGCGKLELATPRHGEEEVVLIPMGHFRLVEPGKPPSESTRVDTFYLDVYEVTTQRFDEFLEHYDEWRTWDQPAEHAGRYDRRNETGWRKEWDTALPEDAATFRHLVTECVGVPQSTFAAKDQTPSLPMNCVTWLEAFAFCIWDGGRLPTEGEFMYATAGGEQNRFYPWGSEPAPTREHAVYGCIENPTNPPCGFQDILPVGSRPLGKGRWGNHDLAGSMGEWVFDGAHPDLPLGASNPARMEDESNRMIRGGNWVNDAQALSNAARMGADPALRNSMFGFRCARDSAPPE